MAMFCIELSFGVVEILARRRGLHVILATVAHAKEKLLLLPIFVHWPSYFDIIKKTKKKSFFNLNN